MEDLGPFEPSPTLAVAVSGGPDSMALAILADAWVRPGGGYVLGLVVDHALRATSAAEAWLTTQRLAALGIASRLLTLTDLRHGPALAERARIDRYRALAAACRAAGILHLLLGHHAADQIETLTMRILRGSQTHGLAGMSALRETDTLRLLRPLLTVDPALFRTFLLERQVDWVEDPSNRDVRALRPRLRAMLASAPGGRDALLDAAALAGRLRQREETAIARELAEHATIRPEGFALVSAGRISPSALSRLVQAIGGAAYPPSPGLVAPLAVGLQPATLAGVRIMPAGRLGPGFLIVREAAAMSPPIPAEPRAVWDGRFRVVTSTAGASIGPLGDDTARLRRLSNLPAALLRTLPAFRLGDRLVAVPSLAHGDAAMKALFHPPVPLAGPNFVARAAGGTPRRSA